MILQPACPAHFIIYFLKCREGRKQWKTTEKAVSAARQKAVESTAEGISTENRQEKEEAFRMTDVHSVKAQTDQDVHSETGQEGLSVNIRTDRGVLSATMTGRDVHSERTQTGQGAHSATARTDQGVHSVTMTGRDAHSETGQGALHTETEEVIQMAKGVSTSRISTISAMRMKAESAK